MTLLDLVGNTPIVRLERLAEPEAAEVWVKLEAANPTGSYKDRMARAMIEGAERTGKLAPGRPVVESSRSRLSLPAIAVAKPTPSGICPAGGGDPSGTIPLGGIVLANKEHSRREDSNLRPPPSQGGARIR